MQMDPALLLPEIIVFLGGLVVLMGGSFLPRYLQWIARTVAALALLGAAVAAVVAMADPPQAAFAGTYAVDFAAGAGWVSVALARLFVARVRLGGVARTELDAV